MEPMPEPEPEPAPSMGVSTSILMNHGDHNAKHLLGSIEAARDRQLQAGPPTESAAARLERWKALDADRRALDEATDSLGAPSEQQLVTRYSSTENRAEPAIDPAAVKRLAALNDEPDPVKAAKAAAAAVLRAQGSAAPQELAPVRSFAAGPVSSTKLSFTKPTDKPEHLQHLAARSGDAGHGQSTGAGAVVPRGQHRFSAVAPVMPAAPEVSAEERKRVAREAAIRRQDAAAAEAARAAAASAAAAAADAAGAAADATAAVESATYFAEIDDALAKIMTDNVNTPLRVVPAGLVDAAVKVLQKVVGNIVANPGEAKFRRLKKTNKMVEGKLLPCRGAVQLLIACGFRSADGVLSLANDKVDLARLEYAVDRLGRLEEEKQAAAGGEAKAAEAARVALFKQQQEAKREEARVKLSERQKVAEQRAEFARRAQSDSAPWEPAAEPAAEPQ
jgi:hypothetical protein